MEKERTTRVITIIALCVAIVGLSIGFAAFTRDLNITFSDSNVKVSGDLDVKFLASQDPSNTEKEISYSLNTTSVAGKAQIGNDGLTINGLSVTFSDKGQSVEYDFYVYNNSEYDAYLKKVEFLNYTDASTNKVCTALTGTTQSLVDDACDDILLTINIAGHDIMDTKTSNFTSPMIEKGKLIPVKITINYDDGEDSALLPNGDFKINFGGIKLNYSSLVSENSGGTTIDPIDPDAGGADNGEVEMISFTVSGQPYQAEEDMTWEEWVDSEYNTSGFRYNDDTMFDDSVYFHTLSRWIVGVKRTDVIENDGDYQIYTIPSDEL